MVRGMDTGCSFLNEGLRLREGLEYADCRKGHLQADHLDGMNVGKVGRVDTRGQGFPRAG